MIGKLYIVGTPIGNLQDFSPRAIETLKSVDFIGAEDTRVTSKLLNKFEIKKPMISYYQHNIRERGEQILNRIIQGEDCAIVSDAGMPCISDPGEDLVALCRENNIVIIVVPSPTAVTSALALSGLSTSRFTFEGFLSTAKNNRREHLSSLVDEKRTMVFYEAPHKLLNTLTDMHEYFGDRRISISRELTKIYEQTLLMTLSQAVEYYTENKPKGEFVLVLEGDKSVEQKVELEEVLKIGIDMVANGDKATDVSKLLAKKYGYRKNEIYNGIAT